MDPLIKEKVCILRPTKLHEVVQKQIIAKEELLGSKGGDKTLNLSFYGKHPRRGGQDVKHNRIGSNNQVFQKNNTFNNKTNKPRQHLQQSNARTQESFQSSIQSTNKKVKLMKLYPTNGCWTCGGPHYERD